MHSIGAAPARPDGESWGVRSYARRGSRLSARQRSAWTEHARDWVIAPEVQYAGDFRFPHAFARPGPLVAEIGIGDGQALAAAAIERGECNLIGLEVWQPGVADCLAALAALGATNVRLSTLDAAWAFEHTLDPGSLAELWTFFPDPWPKARHRKRRLVDPRFAGLAASRLASGGVWRLATDWADYAEQMRQALDGVPMLSGGVSDRYAGRPITRFERRALAEGRRVTDLTYTRVI